MAVRGAADLERHVVVACGEQRAARVVRVAGCRGRKQTQCGHAQRPIRQVARYGVEPDERAGARILIGSKGGGRAASGKPAVHNTPGTDASRRGLQQLRVQLRAAAAPAAGAQTGQCHGNAPAREMPGEIAMLRDVAKQAVRKDQGWRRGWHFFGPDDLDPSPASFVFHTTYGFDDQLRVCRP